MKKPSEKVTFRGFERNLPLSSIEIAETNVRKSHRESRLEQLKASIARNGLLHPVIVLQRGNKYQVIVGQRRYLAFKALGKETIPALVINPVSKREQTIMSFGENIHRRDLPYEDTIRVCSELFKAFGATTSLSKIQKISQELGLPPQTVSKYVSYRLVPPQVRKLVTAGKLGRGIAYRITTAYWPNVPKIVRIAKHATVMTTEEKKRLIQISRKMPNASIEEILEKVEKGGPTYELVIPLDMETYNLLDKVASKRGTDIVDFVREAIEELLPDLKEELE